jgi:hypothetical protein
MSGLNLSAAQCRALAAYALPGRRMFIEQDDENRLHGGPIKVAIGELARELGANQYRRVAEVTIAENGNPEWKAA